MYFLITQMREKEVAKLQREIRASIPLRGDLHVPAILIAHVSRLSFDFVQAANRVQRLFGQLAFVRHVQIEKLAAGVGQPISMMPFSNMAL